MNLEKLCQDLIVKKFNSSEVQVYSFKEKKSQLPYGSLHIQFEIGESVGECTFLTKYPKMLRENLKQHNLFQSSHFREIMANLILKDFKEMFEVSFTPEIFFTSHDFIVYNVDPTLSLTLDYSEEQFEIGLSTLAKFHATCEAYNNSNSKQYNIDEIKLFREDPFNAENFMKISTLICKYLKDIQEIYPNTILDDICAQDIEDQLNIVSRKLKNIGECKKLLINGNYFYSNLIFDAMNTDCQMIDFSCMAYHSPLFDIFQYVNSFSSILNWKSNVEKVKILYYNYLKAELKKINIDINKTFPKEEYQETFELLLPIMKIIFYLKPIYKNLEDFMLITESNMSSLSSSYFELSEILKVLNLKVIEENHSIVSFEDCYLVFKKSNKDNSQLAYFNTKQQAGRNGFLGEHYDMIIGTENQGKQTSTNFFLKGVPRAEALQEFEQTVGSFFKETMFYSRYVPLLKEYGIDILDEVVPECFFANEHKYIIMDDLKSYGYSTISPRSEIGNEVILGVIEILAKLNASCIILEELIERKTGCKYRLSDTFERELNEAFFSLAPVIESHRNAGAGGMKALTELIEFDDELSNVTFKTLAKDACDEQVLFAKPSTKWRNTLCHGDFWTKNYMIQSEEERVKSVMMIDFQTYRYAPPAQDLMACIFLNTTKKSRQELMSKWLDSYYEAFTKNLGIYSIDIDDILPRRDFDDSCRFYEQFAITQSITHFQIILIPPEIIDPLLEDDTKAREVFLETRYDLVKMVWEIDELYCRRLTESVGELRRCLIGKMN